MFDLSQKIKEESEKIDMDVFEQVTLKLFRESNLPFTRDGVKSLMMGIRVFITLNNLHPIISLEQAVLYSSYEKLLKRMEEKINQFKINQPAV